MIIQQIIQYLISFSASDILNVSYFNELNMTRFLNQFKLLNENHEVKNVILIKKLSKYCELKIQKKMQFKLIKKHDVNLQDSIIMIFSRLYKDRLKKAQKMKQEHNLDKKMRKNTFKKLN